MKNLDFFLRILLCVSEFADFVYNNDLKDLHTKNLAMIPCLSHTLLTYLKKCVQAYNPAAKKSNNLRGLMAQNPIELMTLKEAKILLPYIIDIFSFCVIGDNMGMLACSPSHNTYYSPPPSPRDNLKTSPKTRLPRSLKLLPPRYYPSTYSIQGLPQQLLCKQEVPPSNEDDSQPLLPETHLRGLYLPRLLSLLQCLSQRILPI